MSTALTSSGKPMKQSDTSSSTARMDTKLSMSGPHLCLHIFFSTIGSLSTEQHAPYKHPYSYCKTYIRPWCLHLQHQAPRETYSFCLIHPVDRNCNVHQELLRVYSFSCYWAGDNFFWLHYFISTDVTLFYNPRLWYLLVLLNIFTYWCLMWRFSSVESAG